MKRLQFVQKLDGFALVLAMAKRFRMGDMDFGDLISEGNMALLRSIDKFDIERQGDDLIVKLPTDLVQN